MYIILLFSLIQAELHVSNWTPLPPEIYTVQFLVAMDSGDFYALDPQSFLIAKIDRDGANLLKGRQGQGPGALNTPQDTRVLVKGPRAQFHEQLVVIHTPLGKSLFEGFTTNGKPVMSLGKGMDGIVHTKKIAEFIYLFTLNEQGLFAISLYGLDQLEGLVYLMK